MKIFDNIYVVPNNFNGVCKIIKNNSINYFKNGTRHKEDGPAIEYENGECSWYFKDGLYGIDDQFTVQSWMIFIEELQREERLKIFI